MSDNLYFYTIPTRNISDKFAIIRDLGRFLQPGLISSTTFLKKIDFHTANHRSRRVTREGEGEGNLPCPFLKIGKKCPNLEKKCPDCGHL